MTTPEALVFFCVFVLALLALDLGVFQRRPHAPSFREAASWSAFWITLSLGFNAWIYFSRGSQPALEFFTAYLLEKSLSLDNLAVFALVLSTLAVPPRLQHKVLFWGVLGAVAMRTALILSGVALISRLDWVLYIFGGILLITGVRLFRKTKTVSDRSSILRLARKLFPVTEESGKSSFLLWREGKLLATPLFVALIMVETTDLLFAADSIPAVFTVTRDPFIALTSNILAVLGLRALYFLLAGGIRKLRHLRAGLSLVLIFLGAKMLLSAFYEISTLYSLLVISAILAVTVATSLSHKPLPRPFPTARPARAIPETR